MSTTSFYYVPWDRLVEAVGVTFVDISDVAHRKGTKSAENAAAKAAAEFYVKNPTETVFYVRDPDGALSAKSFPAALEEWLSDPTWGTNHGAFGFDSSDQEIYADGADAFGGEWDYYVTKALDAGQNQALEKMPPKVNLEPVQGKTGAGWKLTISHPYKAYLDAGVKVAEKRAAELATSGIFPEGKQGPMSAAPVALRQKYLKAGSNRIILTRENTGESAVGRIKAAQTTDMARIRKLAGIP